MITNIRLELDDDARRAIASIIAGKPVKRLATRAQVVSFVTDMVAVEISATRWQTSPDRVPTSSIRVSEKPEILLGDPRAGQTVRTAGTVEFNQIPDRDDFCSDDCCRRNELLQSRVNVLQHRLDTGSRS